MNTISKHIRGYVNLEDVAQKQGEGKVQSWGNTLEIMQNCIVFEIF